MQRKLKKKGEGVEIDGALTEIGVEAERLKSHRKRSRKRKQNIKK